ncbi:MAG: cell division protein FtsA [Omnitrophica WOR_2 bacterium GWA2_47_8]|nr:MAG: cell division protein FtsA [Omnitrophica WOR_2 bacterium GWA2_47_8]
MLGKFGERYICGLDLGSCHTKASLLKVTESSEDLIGAFELRTRGFREASVSDLSELTECVHQTIEGLTKNTAIKLKELYLGVGGELVESRHNTTVIPLVERGSKIIGGYDIKRINKQARFLGLKVDEEVLHDFPQYYKVDDVNTALNPLGLFGRKLEVNSLLLVSNLTKLRNITKAVNQAGYEVGGIYFTSYGALSVCSKNYTKDDIFILVDIGWKVTDILLITHSQIKSLIKVPLGGHHITEGLAQSLCLSYELAEEIKKTYAIALVNDPRNEEEILVKKEANYDPIKRKEIAVAIQPAIQEFLQALKERLVATNMLEHINKGIVMVGGGALLPGLMERLEEEIRLPVNSAKMTVGTKTATLSPVFAPVMGIAKLGIQKVWGEDFASNGNTRRMDLLLTRLRDLYQEYF